MRWPEEGAPILTCGWDGFSGQLPEPGGDGLADLGAGVFLDEMDAGRGHLGLVRPGTAEVPDQADQDAAQLGTDEQLWQPGRRGQPGGAGPCTSAGFPDR